MSHGNTVFHYIKFHLQPLFSLHSPSFVPRSRLWNNSLEEQTMVPGVTVHRAEKQEGRGEETDGQEDG